MEIRKSSRWRVSDNPQCMESQVKSPGAGLTDGYRADPTWKPLYKIGGIALLAEGLAYLIVTVTSPIIGVAPGNNMKYLHALTQTSGNR